MALTYFAFIAFAACIATCIQASFLDSLFHRHEKYPSHLQQESRTNPAKEAIHEHHLKSVNTKTDSTDEYTDENDPIRTFERVVSISVQGHPQSKAETNPSAFQEYMAQRIKDEDQNNVAEKYLKDGRSTSTKDTVQGDASDSGLQKAIRAAKKSILGAKSPNEIEKQDFSHDTSRNFESSDQKQAFSRYTDISPNDADALKRRIEDAMASLTNVYDTLLHRETILTSNSNGESINDAEVEKMHDGQLAKIRTERFSADQKTPLLDESKASTRPKNGKFENILDVVPIKATSRDKENNEEHLKDRKKGENSAIDGHAFELVADTKTAKLEDAKPVPGDQSDKPSNVAKTALSAFAGIAFLAAIGLMIAGLAYNRRDNQAQTSLPYPPSGPSFV